jgi:hypothetical protein
MKPKKVYGSGFQTLQPRRRRLLNARRSWVMPLASRSAPEILFVEKPEIFLYFRLLLRKGYG